MSDEGELPESVAVDLRGEIAVVTLRRAHKRNAVDRATLLGLERFFREPPSESRVVVLAADGDHFCAGLDLSDLDAAGVEAGLEHSRMWHRVTTTILTGRVPVVSVLKGAVIGGGLEIASATHIRVAERSAFYALPEGQRGLFLGGGGSVRLARLIGVSRMTDLMLTGRVYDAQEGHAAGLSHYLVDAGAGLEVAVELAARIAQVAPMTTYAVLQALPRVAEVSPDEGYLLEGLMAAAASSSEDGQRRMREFLQGRAAKVRVEDSR